MTDFDLLIVGGGPAGLAAAIQGASEGMKVCVLDAAPSLGGRAQESAAIENYPMPVGITSATGADLAAGFVNQARKFRAELVCPAKAVSLISDGARKVILSEDYGEFVAKAVILANGLAYQKLRVQNIGAFLGRGVYYGMPPIVNDAVKKTVAVIGGANSAGQAALRYARSAQCSVKVIVRSKIEGRMSQYLVDRIKAAPNIEVIEGVSVTCVGGERSLERIGLNDGRFIDASIMSIYIGAVPYTQWLSNSGIELDKHKFVKAASFATSLPGVFAAGDVRSGSTKRIATAIGEGAAALQYASRFIEGGAA